ncbi:hypothetical protein J2S74_003155 [Evansella vedderi]|uniref:Ribosomal protein L14 n=1 Tax=Evansella vedderi TaxID=38282 RepID=A0ABT9ZZ99_9BACI|nr:hypothetical protein [Evansella vedderi]
MLISKKMRVWTTVIIFERELCRSMWNVHNHLAGAVLNKCSTVIMGDRSGELLKACDGKIMNLIVFR